MRQTKLWFATATVLLCGAASVNGQNVTVVTSPGELKVVPPPPVAISQAEVLLIEEGPMQVEANTEPSPTILSVDDGLLSTTSINGANGMRQYEYTSSVITLSGPSNVLYFTFLETHTEPQYVTNENRRQYPFVALSEFQIYDANGKEIELEASNFSSNAQEISEGPIADICDGNRSTYFHSTWSSQTSDYHCLRIELPDTLSAFSFKYYTRDWVRCIPKKIAIKGMHRYQIPQAEKTTDPKFLNHIINGVNTDSSDVYIEAMEMYINQPATEETFDNIIKYRKILAAYYEKNQRYDDAMALYRKLLGDEKNLEVKAALYYSVGECLYRKKDYGRAQTNYNNAIALNPEYGEAYYKLALCYEHIKFYKDPLKDRYKFLLCIDKLTLAKDCLTRNSTGAMRKYNRVPVSAVVERINNLIPLCPSESEVFMLPNEFRTVGNTISFGKERKTTVRFYNK